MTFEIALMLAALLAAVVLFSLEWFTADTIALGLLVTLVLTGLLPVERAFDGFGSDTVIVILALLILTAALTRTGMIDIVGRAILRRTGDNPDRLLAVIMVSSAGLGAFMSNTASTAFFVPIVIGIAQRAGFSASRLLLPLAFAGILSSSVSLISTSSNLVISGLMTQKGLAPMGMFELAPVGIPITVAGLLYMYFIGRRLTPDRGGGADLIEQFGVTPYLAEALIPPGSPLAGQTLGETKFGSDLDLTVLEVIRDKDRHFAPRTTMKLAAGDVLLVEGRPDEILKIKETAGVEIKADVKLADPDLEDDEIGLVEVILMPGSPLIGRTLKGARFRERYGLQVIGMNRRGTNLRTKLSTVSLRMGDVLLVQGPRVHVAALNDDHTFRVLGSLEEKIPRGRRALLAGAIFAAAILLGTFKIVPLSIAFLAGCVLVFATRCITPEEAYREVEWRVLILIASMLGFGVAMEHTGTANYLAGVLLGLAGDANPLWLLSGFFFLTVALTQPMSNQAAAAVILPIAIQTAQSAGLNPRTFAMMVAVAASTSYLTPLEPCCMMVFGPGRYRFADFLKVGALLTVIVFTIAILLVPRFWPLR